MVGLLAEEGLSVGVVSAADMRHLGGVVGRGGIMIELRVFTEGEVSVQEVGIPILEVEAGVSDQVGGAISEVEAGVSEQV